MDHTKRPRCSPQIAAAYRRKEGGLTSATVATEQGMALGVSDRRAVVWELVDERLGLGATEGVRCEPYLRDAIYRWLLGATRSEDSARSYLGRIARYCADTDSRSLSAHTDASPARVGDWLYGLEAAGLAARTVVHHRDVLRSWFGWLVERELIRRSPITRDLRRAFRVDHRAIVRGDGRRQALSQEDAQRLATWALTRATPAQGLAILLQLTGGLRSAEVAGLELRHLVQRDGVATLTVPGKGNRSRQIVLEAAAVAAWTRYAAATRRQGTRGALLRRPGGGHYHRRSIQAWAKAGCRQALGRSADLSSHDLRRTALTLLLEHGAALDEAQAQAGHASPATTARAYVVRRGPMAATTGLTSPPSGPNGEGSEPRGHQDAPKPDPAQDRPRVLPAPATPKPAKPDAPTRAGGSDDKK